MSEFTRTELREFREDFNKAVASLKEQYGVTIDLGSISYSANKFTTRLTVMKLGEDGVVKLQDEGTFRIFCQGTRINPDWYGKTFTVKGTTFKVAGINPNRPKYPLDLINVDTGVKSKATERYPEFYLK